jgi:hypothetical protein
MIGQTEEREGMAFDLIMEYFHAQWKYVVTVEKRGIWANFILSFWVHDETERQWQSQPANVQ